MVSAPRRPHFCVNTTAGTRCATAPSSVKVPVNTWVHLAGTYDGTTLRVYLNGTQVTSATATGANFGGSATTPVTIGAAYNDTSGTPTDWLKGIVDDVRLYHGALTRDQIVAIRDFQVFDDASEPDPTLGMWNFEDNSQVFIPPPTTAADFSSYSNNGNLLNGTAWSAGVGSGRGGLLFDGSNDKVRVTPNGSIDNVLVETFSIAAYVKHVPTNTTDTIMDRRLQGSTGGQFWFALGNSGEPLIYIKTSAGLFSARATATVPANEWAHVAVTYDGYRLRLYIEAIEVASAPANGYFKPEGTPLTIGYVEYSATNSSLFLKGGMDEVFFGAFTLDHDSLLSMAAANDPPEPGHP